jgi:hypothetical protein
MLKRGGSIPKERRMSSHAPLGMMNTQDEHEPHQAPNRGNLGFFVERKKFLDRSRRRRKEREADRMSQIKEQLK